MPKVLCGWTGYMLYVMPALEQSVMAGQRFVLKRKRRNRKRGEQSSSISLTQTLRSILRCYGTWANGWQSGSGGAGSYSARRTARQRNPSRVVTKSSLDQNLGSCGGNDQALDLIT